MTRLFCLKTFKWLFQWMKSKSLILRLMSLVCFLIVAGLCYFFSYYMAIFPVTFLLFFFLFLFIVSFRASVHAGSTSGLHKLREPDFWVSSTYPAWLYQVDSEGWAVYASLISFIISFISGSILGVGFLVIYEVNYFISLVSWISGISLMLSVVIVSVTTVAFELAFL